MVNPDNVARLHQAIEDAEVTGPFMPAVFVIEPVSECNIRCVTCPNRQMSPSNWGYLDIDRFEGALAEIAPFCEFLMLYWMGEPTLHPRLAEFLKLARRWIDGKIVVSSNFTRTSEDLRRAILSNADIALSCIDRWDKRAFERVRQGASFDAVVANTEALLNERHVGDRCEIVVKALDISHSTSEYEAFVDYWSARGGRTMCAWLNDWAGTLHGLRNAASLPIPMSTGHRVPCADLWFKLVMNWKGNIQMCCFDWNYQNTIGSSGSARGWLRDVWHGESIVALRRAHVAGRWSATDLCSSCTSWGEAQELTAYTKFTEDSYFRVF